LGLWRKVCFDDSHHCFRVTEVRSKKALRDRLLVVFASIPNLAHTVERLNVRQSSTAGQGSLGV